MNLSVWSYGASLDSVKSAEASEVIVRQKLESCRKLATVIWPSISILNVFIK